MLLNAIIGFFQEYRAEKATEALQKLVPANAKVVRDGEVTIVAAADLVPGDILVLEEGDSISADARVVRQYELSTNNIALTGESDAVRKTADPILEEELAIINMPNLVFMGTSVASGTGRARGVRHRAQDRVRAHLLADGRRRRGEVAAACARSTAWRGPCPSSPWSAACALFFMGSRPRASTGSSALLFALGVMVALVPEGLPATLSVALSIGVQRMAKAKALIKKPRRRRDARVDQRHLHRQDRHAHQGRDDASRRSGPTATTWRSPAPATHPTATSWSATPSSPKDEARRRLEPLLRAMTFCNDAKVLPPSDDKGWRVIGDPTEGCLLVAAQKADFDLQAELIERPKIYELPFESVRKRMSVVHVEGDGQQAYVKGAPSETLGRCTHMRLDGDVVAHDRRAARAHRGAERRDVAPGAARARRLRARPARTSSIDYTPDTVETDLTFLGLVGMIDPPRPEVTEAVEEALDGRHPHHHGHRRLRPDGRGHRPPHRHRARRQAACASSPASTSRR